MSARSAGGDPPGTRSKGRPKLQEATAIDGAIRDAALNVLLEHGEAATLNAVAVAAGLSRKTVYARYSNKSALFIEVIRELLEGAMGVEYDATGSAEQRLFNYIEAAIKLVRTPKARSIQRLLTVDVAYIAALKAEMLSATRKHFFLPLVELLREADRNGEFVIAHVEATANVLITMIFADSVNPHDEEKMWCSPGDPEGHAEFVTNLITRGLLPRGPG